MGDFESFRALGYPHALVASSQIFAQSAGMKQARARVAKKKRDIKKPGTFQCPGFVGKNSKETIQETIRRRRRHLLLLLLSSFFRTFSSCPL